MAEPVEVRAARDPEQWRHAAELLFSYQRETAAEVGAAVPEAPEQVWEPVRREVTDPASVLDTYLVAYEEGLPVGGVALVAHDALSIRLARGYVRPESRRRGVARGLVNHAEAVAEERAVTRLVLDILPSRQGAIAAWRRMGFAPADPWGDTSLLYFERLVGEGRAPAWVGLRLGEASLSGGDRRWAAVFQHQAEVVRRTLGDRMGAVEHVGSTAVEGLVAKPIVDVAVRLAPEADEDDVLATLESRGYRFRGDKGDEGGLLFALEDPPGVRLAHIHVVHHADAQWARYLAFRDRLRASEAVRHVYSGLKVWLAGRFPSDRGEYTAGKAEFVAELLSAPEHSEFLDL